MPVTWTELQRLRKPSDLAFSPAAALSRLRKRGDLFAPVLTLKQKLPKAFGSKTFPGSAALKAYKSKRDFSQTAEPGPILGRRTRGKSARFVIQKHAATRLHYDFRLEMDGTLKSWAVPKGVSTEPGVKRAAFAVEDHPIDYLKFEGTIPKGQYGGGTVMVWDIGTYELLGGSYEGGDLKLRLAGKKLKGEWHMFKIRSEDGKDVWLIAKSGAAAKPITLRQDDSSALTRRSMARIATDNDAHWQSDRH
jgi:bifunctional non-homologous end joining protein LigD